ncbi:MAG: DUF1566 domain-containing protein [Dysgonamonadaceae bacterium]|nr:DUF1566 domain-containing protein [Dysgonamonadaceae bacterium]
MAEPAKGALLDLNKTVKGGLALSNVTLEDLYTIPATFSGMTPAPADLGAVKSNFRGAIVYHTGGYGIPIGVYVWNGTNWTFFDENCTPLTALTLTASTLLVKTGDPITFSVASGASERCAEGEEYDWKVNSVSSQTSVYPESSWTTSFSPAGTYTVKVDASDHYADYTSAKATSNEVTVYVTDGGAVPAELIDGKYSINGTPCYDVNLFGDLTKTYTFTYDSDYSELTVLNPGGIIAGVSQPVPTHNTGSGSIAFTITFVPDVKEQVLANSAPLSVKLLVAYKNNNLENKIASLNLKAQDGECCPGVIIPGGVHVYDTNTDPAAEVVRAIGDGTRYENLLGTNVYGGNAISAPYFSKLYPAKDLCVYYRDASSNRDWASAISYCSSANPVAIDAEDATMGGWRSPNIAELGYISRFAVANAVNGASIQFDQLTSVEGADYRTVNMAARKTGSSYDYWSSTAFDSGRGIFLMFDGAGTYWHNKGTAQVFRCVRTMD